jgi:hypothetical protein
LDQFTKEGLCTHADRRQKGKKVVEQLDLLVAERGAPNPAGPSPLRPQETKPPKKENRMQNPIISAGDRMAFGVQKKTQNRRDRRGHP